MPSMVSREQVEDELVRAGIRNPVLRRIMRTVDLYALAQVQCNSPAQEDVPIPPDPLYAGLLPGDHDMELKVTRCKQCLIPKEWHLFGQDLDSPTRHKNVCKACERGPRMHRVSDWQQKWFCPGCEKRLEPEFWGERKKANPRLRHVKCLSCSGKLL